MVPHLSADLKDLFFNFMQQVQGVEKLLSISPRKRFGKRWEYGTRFFGNVNFGDFEKYIGWSFFGTQIYGNFTFADLVIFSGIWREFRKKIITYLWTGPYFGARVYGDFLFGDLSSYNRTYTIANKKTLRSPYYITKNPRSAPQQAWRQIFAAAVSAWQGLTVEQKIVYHRASMGKHMSGYNVFLKEYLLSH